MDAERIVTMIIKDNAIYRKDLSLTGDKSYTLWDRHVKKAASEIVTYLKQENKK